MSADSIAAEIRSELKKQADPKRAKLETRYFKETIKCYGASLWKARKIEKETYAKHKEEIDLKTSLQLADKLLNAGWFEEGFIGLCMVARHKKEFTKQTFKTFEKWAGNYIANWAHSDDLSAHLIAPVLEKYPELAKQLVSWTSSPNRWKRRIAAVSFIYEAGKGKHFNEIFTIARVLMNDKDDLVQKGSGWMLREAVKGNEKKTLAFLEKYKLKLPRTTLRYAIERLPQKKRKELLRKQ
ncbi:DNA alkylation repair protein [Candidatus Woesearchaeota archaeon]|nr:DNA alkylation repair protein [Candidatus Woesearchaeota archaeon]